MYVIYMFEFLTDTDLTAYYFTVQQLAINHITVLIKQINPIFNLWLIFVRVRKRNVFEI